MAGSSLKSVAPFTGAWIEINVKNIDLSTFPVAPFTGAWIEIGLKKLSLAVPLSLPSRGRGLKFLAVKDKGIVTSRSLHGGVD